MSGIKIIVRNRKAYHDYEVIDKIEAGIELVGTEVKSIREGKINLLDSYGYCSPQNEIYIEHMHISPFEQGNRYNHNPYRKRKLLLHKKEILRLADDVKRSHLTLIPLVVYFKKSKIKIELGLCRGRKHYDKRAVISKRENQRRLSNIMKAKGGR